MAPSRPRTVVNGPPLDEAFSKAYTTWVRSSLIPRFREEAPSLDELCTALIATLGETPTLIASAAGAKPLKTATAPAHAEEQNDREHPQNHGEIPARGAEIWDPNRGRLELEERLLLDDGLFKAFPDFTSYGHLESLNKHSKEELRGIATKIMEIQLRWMDEERVEATWVTPNILLDGILGSMDPTTLQALCQAHSFKHVVMISIHPDDWVAGAVWKAHGRLKWTKRPSSAQERDAGVHERLVHPLWDQPERHPQIIVQSDIEYHSPVIDHLIIPLEDGDGSSLLMQLPDICTFVSQHNRPETLIVIHCKVGLSRSNAGQEAFVLHAVYRELRRSARWMFKDAKEKQGDLQTMCQTYHKSVQRRRPDLKSKFRNQMANWAKYLAEDEPECGPEFATDQTSPGGNDMRDAAITACYELGCLLPRSLIAHYHKRTGAGVETAQKTIRRFRKAEQELHAGMDMDGLQDTTSRLSIAQFVNLCEAKHQSRNPGGNEEKP